MFPLRKCRDSSRLRCTDPPLSAMFRVIRFKLRRLCSKLRRPARRKSKPTIVVRRFGQSANSFSNPSGGGRDDEEKSCRPIRVATFNAATFSMAQAVPKASKSRYSDYPDHEVELDVRGKVRNDRLKGILKQATQSSEAMPKQRKLEKSKMRVSINLPDNEISLERSQREKAQLQTSASFPMRKSIRREEEVVRSERSVLEVLKEVDADVIGLQDVKADEANGMKPLSDLADALGMKYVFAESWAPEYGNAVLSKWPIKRWKVQKIFDDSDFRNVLKVTVDVANAGEVNFYCTQLDHLDESWRMKQIHAILQPADEGPHILAGGLNALDETDYSQERWKDIVKYYEEIGKPTPKVEVMKFLKEKNYSDSKDFAGECESVVIIAKGQDVQGTCKYGTRVDYILSSPGSPYTFVPGSYSVISSKGTSDHHVVRVSFTVAKVEEAAVTATTAAAATPARQQQRGRRVVRMNGSSSRGIWKANS